MSEATQVTPESYDDSVTWHAVTANATSNGFASLRATARDRAGDQVEQTFIHAYRIKAWELFPVSCHCQWYETGTYAKRRSG